MPLNRIAARKLLNASEMPLFEAALRGEINRLDRAQVRGKIARARRLRDKYRDLFRRQRVSTRERTGTKAGPRGTANLRTREKAALMEELLARFRQRLDEIEQAERRAAAAAEKARRRARIRQAGTRRGTARKPGAAAAAAVRAGYMSGAADIADMKRRQHKSRGIAIRAHLRAQGRRNQAKRDRRR
jgi:hypothetical protein